MTSRTPPRGTGSPLRQSPLQESHVESSHRNSRYAAQPFQYNVRVAVSLVPSLVILLGAGRAPVVFTFVVGLTLSYILDVLQFKHGAFLGMWGSFAATAGAAAFSGVGFGPHLPIWLSFAVLMTCFHLIFLCGIWASIQFKWLQVEYPTIVIALERILFSCCPITGVVIQTWGLIASVGIANAPFYLIPIQFAHFWMFSLPQPSSFSKSSTSSPPILGPLELSLHNLLVLLLPALLHFAVHHYMILRQLNDLCDLLLLSFLPVFVLLFGSTRGALSWITTNPKVLRNLRLYNGLASVVVVLFCVEVRVIFTSFSHYIPLPFPWNYLLVSVALYGLALTGGVALLSEPSPTLTAAVASAMGGAAVAAAIVLGMPWHLIPAPVASAVGVALLLTLPSPSLWAHALLSSGLLLSSHWFLQEHFGFLHARLAGLPLPSLSLLLLLAMLLALAVPASTLLPEASLLTGALLVSQAALLARVEEGLYGEEGASEWISVYPSYLVVLTSVAGVVAGRRLERQGKVQRWAVWLSSSLHLAKLSVLLLPSSPNVLLHSLLLALPLTAPLLLYDPKWLSPIRSAVGVVHCAVLAVCVWLARPSLVEALLALTEHVPPPTLVVALLILLWAASSLPLLSPRLLLQTSLRRSLLLLLSLALLLFLLEPPLPKVLSSLVAPDSLFLSEAQDDLAMYSLGSPSPTSYADWLLIAALLASLAAATSALPLLDSSLVVSLYTSAVALSFGLYLCLHYFTRAPWIHPLLILALISAALTILFSCFPSPSSSSLTFWSRPLFLLLLCLLPATWLVVPLFTTASPSEADAEEYYTDLAVEDLRISLLALFAALFLLLAFAVKLKLAKNRKDSLSGTNGQLPKSSPFAAKHRSFKNSGLQLKRLFSPKLLTEAVWLPAMGNISTLLCFFLALFLSHSSSSGNDHRSEIVILVMAPLLLLLTHDGSHFAPLSDRQRYFPMALAVSSYLASTTLWTVVQELYYSYQFSGLQWGDNYGMFSAARDLGLVLLALPNHAAFNKYLWDFQPQSDYFLLVVTPLTLPGIFLSSSSPIRVLASVGLVYAVGQFLFARHIRISGLKYI